MIRALALTGGATVPSARFRVRQFLGRLERWGVALEERASRVGSYPPVATWQRPGWLAATLLDRVPDVAATHRADVTVLQRELVSTLVTLEGLTKRPRVLDVDDALWALPRGGFAARLARRCDRVIAGNAFLAEWFGRHCRDVMIVPTAVDTARFVPAGRPPSASVVIGWSGASGGLPYVEALAPALAAVMARRPEVRLCVLSDRAPRLEGLPPERVEYVRWRPEVEVPTIQGFDLGLMPLRDSTWERGKCSYKMLLYMACGVPALVSPVGMNVEVLAHGEVGTGVPDGAWAEAILEWVDDSARRGRASGVARRVVEEHFALEALAPRLAAAIAGR
ncbi:MAG: glycosyltransferase family 4 protein [Gemmatimonadota bacterium]|jgi:glycosyltransferase involved in cell wall biosynthesis